MTAAVLIQIENLDMDDWKKNSGESVKTVMQAIQAVTDADGETFMSLCADDMDYKMIGSTPFSGTRKGKQNFTELFGHVASHLNGMIPLEIINMIPAGEWVITETRGNAITKQGKPYQNTYCQLWRVKHGLIVDFSEYLDTQLIMDTFQFTPEELGTH